jgi:hypothetical protein
MFGQKEPRLTEEHLRKWSHIRSRGALYYVLTRGVLLATICEVAGFLIFEVWPGHKSLRSLEHFGIDSIVGLLIAGVVNGSMEWGSNEKRFSRELMQFSSSNYETPEQTLKQLQRGIENGR